jgi:hypothetical protein
MLITEGTGQVIAQARGWDGGNGAAKATLNGYIGTITAQPYFEDCEFEPCEPDDPSPQ